MPEIKLAPRQIFTRSAARADVDRILELYRRQGRFAARVEPKIVQLDQNRVDVVFEIYEGDLAKVRAINILGNSEFSDAPPAQGDVHPPGRRRPRLPQVERHLRPGPPCRRPAEASRLLPDRGLCRLPRRLGARRADARTARTSSSPTSSRKARATNSARSRPTARFATCPIERVKQILKIQPGTWFNAKAVEDAVTDVNEEAGNLGYAFADINPAYDRDAEKRLMNVTLKVTRDAARLCRADRHHRQHVDPRQGHPPRVPPQRRRRVQRAQGQAQPGPHPEPRLFPGQAGDQADRRLGARSRRARASTSRRSRPASCRCRAAIRASRSSSSSSRFRRTTSWARASRSTPRSIIRLIRSRSSSALPTPISSTSRSCSAGRSYRRDYSSFNFIGNQRNTTYTQVSTGGGIRTGFPLTEYWSVGTRYSLVQDKISLDKSTFYTDPDGRPLTPPAIRSRPATICATKSAPG